MMAAITDRVAVVYSQMTNRQATQQECEEMSRHLQALLDGEMSDEH
jgi:hypothetical protein